MKEELYQMLDGDLPDDGVAELLHRLSVDPEKRALFVQHLRLQHALARNGGEETMSSVEAAQMRDKIALAIGAGGGMTPRNRFRGKVLGSIVVGLMVGSGLGFVAERAARSEPPPTPAPLAAPLAPPQVSAPVDTAVSPKPDSTPAVAAVPADTARPVAKSTHRRKSAVRKQSFGNDLTGAPEARALNKKKKHRSSP
jgi:hypothetical protein